MDGNANMRGKDRLWEDSAPLRTILLVDDSPVNLGVVVESLEGHGYDVLVAQDGEEALQRIEVAMPDLVLLDVMMPGMDGFEVCRGLKAHPRTQNIPVIFMTSLHGIEDKVRGFEAGAVDYVTKPLQVDEVRMRVNTHLQLRALQLRLEAKNAALQAEITRREAAERSLQQSFDQIAELNAGLNAQMAQLEAAQELLERTQAWYGNILHSAPDGMLVVDESGCVMQANAKAEALFGYGANALTGLRIEEILPEMGLDTLRSLAASTTGGGPGEQRSGGQSFPVAASISSIPGLDGNEMAFCIVVSDTAQAAGGRPGQEFAINHA